jgi:hypothetical protein
MQNTAVLLLSTPMRLARKGSLAAILHSSSNTTAAFCTATTTWNSGRDLLLSKTWCGKGRDLEKVVLSRAVRWHLENRMLVYQNKTVVFA